MGFDSSPNQAGHLSFLPLWVKGKTRDVFSCFTRDSKPFFLRLQMIFLFYDFLNWKMIVYAGFITDEAANFLRTSANGLQRIAY